MREADAQLSEEGVIDGCRERIASFKIPRTLYFVEQFPMTGSGKIEKYLLRRDAELRVASKATTGSN
jgi:fatty-acyl-CoA synthase